MHHASLKGLGVLNYQNDFISGEFDFLRDSLKGQEAFIVLDVGANVGNYSKKVLEINPKVQLHCFEPHPKTFKVLEENIGFDKAQLNNKGVGETNSTLQLYDYSEADGSSHASLHKGVIEEVHGKDSVVHQVEVIELESYLKEKGIDKVNLLKIDTEGNELAVLKGLGEYLSQKKIEKIHFEFNEMNIFSKSSFLDFLKILEGYQFSRLLPNGKRLPITKYAAVDHEIYAYQNVVAERKG